MIGNVDRLTFDFALHVGTTQKGTDPLQTFSRKFIASTILRDRLHCLYEIESKFCH